MNDDLTTQLRTAASAVAAAGLSDAFGHVSVRAGERSLLITPPVPLGRAGEAPPVRVDVASDELPAGVPLEGWMHLALAAARPEVGSIVRAQPRAVAAFSALGIALPVLGGHGAMLHGVHIHESSRLVRDRATADALAEAAGASGAIILRGNGAVTVGTDAAQAVARMWEIGRAHV